MYENSVDFRRAELEALAAALSAISGTADSRPQWVSDRRRQENFLNICDSLVRKLPTQSEVSA